MKGESAIIIPVPEVEPIVGPFRAQHDSAARLGVPAHITLLYPFRSPPAALKEIDVLTSFFAVFQAFDFSLIEVRRFPATAYLHPDKPERFTQMISALLNEWPDCKPYKGAFAEAVPHLTVADKVDSQTLDFVERNLRDELPVKCFSKEAWLLVSDENGYWSKRASFPFAKSGPSGLAEK